MLSFWSYRLKSEFALILKTDWKTPRIESNRIAIKRNGGKDRN